MNFHKSADYDPAASAARELWTERKTDTLAMIVASFDVIDRGRQRALAIADKVANEE